MIEAREFFNRPNEEVAPKFANYYFDYYDKKAIEDGRYELVHSGEGKVIILPTERSQRLFLVQEIELHSNQRTMDSWPNSRGPEIDSLNPADIVTYNYRGNILPFIKTQKAANIGILSVMEVNKRFEPLSGSKPLVSSHFSKELGLDGKFNKLARLVSVDLRGQLAFLFAPHDLTVTDKQLKRIQDDLISDAENL